MFETFIKSGKEAKIVFHNSFNESKTECLFGKIDEVDNGFIRLVGRNKDVHIVAIKDTISVSERSRVFRNFNQKQETQGSG